MLCDVLGVIRDVPDLIFVRSGLYGSRGDQKHPFSVISDLFHDIIILILGGSHMYTISCKASYTLIYRPGVAGAVLQTP